MDLRNTDVIQNSIIQTSFEYIDNILKDYQKLQPEFKYHLNYGTNLNQDFIEDTDHFNIVMFTGSVDKIPSYYNEINGANQLLYAGYFDIALSIINPIPLLYTDGERIVTIEEPELSDQLYDQELTNNYSNWSELFEDNSKKIEYATRLLEGLSLFLTRRNVVINNFSLTTRADVPIPDGQFEVGYYRLTETLPVSVKFVHLNDIGRQIKSGEAYKVWIKTKSNNNNTEYTDWTEFYNIFDFSLSNTAVDKSFALFDNSTMQSINNQLSRSVSISCPEMEIGACRLLKDLVYSGNLDALQDIQLKYYDGIKYYTVMCTWNWDERPASIDQFNGFSAVFNVVSDITEGGE
jgi:hypothetical protein